MKRQQVFAAAVTAAAIGVFAAPAQAYMKGCSVGQRVEYDGKPGTVVRVTPGPTNSLCYVDFDGGKKNDPSPDWMLSPAGTNARETASLKPGHYECWGQGGAGASAACSRYAGGCVSMHYMNQDINVNAGGAYTDKQGKSGNWRYDNNSKMIAFGSGPYSGWSAKYLSDGKIGLSVKPTSFWSIICDWKR
jgi:hypothetical protein